MPRPLLRPQVSPAQDPVLVRLVQTLGAELQHDPDVVEHLPVL